MKDFIHVHSSRFDTRAEVGYHPASTRTVFQIHGGTFRMKIPNVVSITVPFERYPLFLMRTETEFSLDFKKVELRNVDFWRWCVGERALKLLRRGKINGYDAFLRTVFLCDPTEGTITLEDFVKNNQGIPVQSTVQVSLHDTLEILVPDYEIIPTPGAPR